MLLPEQGLQLLYRLGKGDVDIQQAQAADGAAEIAAHPEARKPVCMNGNPAHLPALQPREYKQKQSEFEGEDDKAEAKNAPVPFHEGGALRWRGRRWRRR